jgi:hypothetical protein
MPSTAMMSATAAAPATAMMATTIGMPATAGATVQSARTPVTVGSLARPPAIARLLQQQGSCHSRAPTTVVPSATAELLPQLFPCNSRTPATAKSMQNLIACNSRDASNHSQRQQQQ